MFPLVCGNNVVFLIFFLVSLHIVVSHSNDELYLLRNVQVSIEESVQIWTSQGSFKDSGEKIQIYWSGVSRPSQKDFVAVYTLSSLTIKNSNNFSLLSVPVQFQYATLSPSHMTNGSGELTFQLLNLREDYVFALCHGNVKTSVLVAKSNPIINENPNQIMHVHLGLVGIEPASMRVTWVTKEPGYPLVRWKSSKNYGTEGFQVAVASSKTFKKEELCGAPANSFGFHHPGYIHTAVMKRLSFGEDYKYQVGNLETGIWSPFYTFKAPPPPGSRETVQFAIFGDMGTAMADGSFDHVILPEQRAALGTMKLIRERLKNSQKNGKIPTVASSRRLDSDAFLKTLDFVLHIGDISYAVGFASHWDEFLTQIQSVASHIPWMVGIGNHERDSPHTSSIRPQVSFYKGTDSGGECGIPYAAYFPMPPPANNFTEDTPWYSFDYGPVHITVISTEHDFQTGSLQYKWLDRVLSTINRQSTPWSILAGHRPMYVSSNNDGPKEDQDLPAARKIREHIEPLMMKHKVDLGVYGHHHSYQRTCKVYREVCIEEVESECFVAPTHVVAGMAGFSLSKGFSSDTPRWLKAVHNESHGIAFISANASHLYFEFVESEGSKKKADDFWLQH